MTYSQPKYEQHPAWLTSNKVNWLQDVCLRFISKQPAAVFHSVFLSLHEGKQTDSVASPPRAQRSERDTRPDITEQHERAEVGGGAGGLGGWGGANKR